MIQKGFSIRFYEFWVSVSQVMTREKYFWCSENEPSRNSWGKLFVFGGLGPGEQGRLPAKCPKGLAPLPLRPCHFWLCLALLRELEDPFFI